MTPGQRFGNALAELGTRTAHERTTQLLRDGDGYRINGRKFYATGAIYAQRIPTSVVDENGVQQLAFVPRNSQGLTVIDDWSGFGQRTTGSGSVVFEAVHVAAEDSPEAIKLLGGLGVEPLGDGFDPGAFHASLKRRKAPIKQVLLAGDVVVGVGNIYASEALFLAGIRPTLIASRISRPRAARLHAAIRDVLARAVARGGSTLRDFSSADGQAGYPIRLGGVLEDGGQVGGRHARATVQHFDAAREVVEKYPALRKDQPAAAKPEEPAESMLFDMAETAAPTKLPFSTTFTKTAMSARLSKGASRIGSRT